MMIKEKLGNLKNFEVNGRSIDLLPLEWYETNKRILHKKTNWGWEVAMKFLKEGPSLTQDDVVYEDPQHLIVIDIVPCDAIVIRPASLYQMACLCYEIGNKHMPLFYEDNEVAVPYETPLFHMLTAGGFQPLREKRKLLHALKTTVSPHSQGSNNSSLFSKILQLTSPSNE